MDKQRSRAIKEGLKKAREAGVVLGNPELARVRNTDVSSANFARKKKADDFARRMESILLDMLFDGFDEKAKVVRELNERRILTRGGTEWSIQKLNRLLQRIYTLCYDESRVFELKYYPHYEYI